MTVPGTWSPLVVVVAPDGVANNPAAHAVAMRTNRTRDNTPQRLADPNDRRRMRLILGGRTFTPTLSAPRTPYQPAFTPGPQIRSFCSASFV